MLLLVPTPLKTCPVALALAVSWVNAFSAAKCPATSSLPLFTVVDVAPLLPPNPHELGESMQAFAVEPSVPKETRPPVEALTFACEMKLMD